MFNNSSVPEPASQPASFEPTQPAGLDSPVGFNIPQASDSDVHRPPGFEETRPIDWEEQALKPDYDELIAAMSWGEDAAPDLTNRKRVLVVDDDLPARLYLRAKLSLLEGVDVYEASSGDEAVAITLSTPFDGVLLDINMSGLDGYEVCRSIKRHARTRGQKIPKIYIVTSRTGVMDRMRATLAGADAFLSKPPHPAELHELLASL
jgi:CheY-like chemotaxis protein